MTLTIDTRLAYGYRQALPADATTAWGARLIYPNDLVPDRTDAFGDPADKDRLFALLNERAPQPADYPPILDREGIRANDTTGTLYEDDDVALKARACGGYLYVVGYLK